MNHTAWICWIVVLLLCIATCSNSKKKIAEERREGMASYRDAEASKEAIELLYRVPHADSSSSAVVFLSDANDVLAYANRNSSQNFDEVVASLEELASHSGPVIAWVQSYPSGVNVWYRRAYQQRNRSNFMVTTDDSIPLSIPSKYYFWTIQPETGDTVEYPIDCRWGCHVILNLKN